MSKDKIRMPYSCHISTRLAIELSIVIVSSSTGCQSVGAMMERHRLPIAKIYVPVKRMKTLEPEKVEALADDILAHGQTTPISVRAEPERERFVLVEGLHRLEALKALGETKVNAFLVQARIR